MLTTRIFQILNVFLYATAISNGQNACFAGNVCDLAAGIYDLSDCGLSDEDFDDLKACLARSRSEDVTKIDLTDNSFTTFPADMFTGFGSLTTLFIGGNDLTSLDVDTFKGMDTIEVLELDSNQLTTLPAGLFDDLTSILVLALLGNDDLQCIPANLWQTGENYETSYVPANADGICGCTPAAAVSCDEGTTCNPGELGYTCDEPCCEDESVASLPCILPADMSKELGETCNNSSGCDCASGNCVSGVCEECPEGIDVCSDPHMHGLRGQRIDWSGVDGGWYCLVKDDESSIQVNVRLTAPLPVGFPDRQLITGLSVVSEGHSLVIEVKKPYTIDTEGCPEGTPICLANGGLHALVDGKEERDLLRPTRGQSVAGVFKVSASNLPVECRQFGGDKIWARMYAEMLEGSRELVSKSFEDWLLESGNMAAPDWCAKYIAERGLDDVQSIHSVLNIETRDISVRLNVGIGYQVGGQLDWDGSVLPDLEFWQMDVGLEGISLEHESMSGILGGTARPVFDEDGFEIMQGYDAFRGTVEDYRVAAATETEFAQLYETGA